MAKFEIAYNRTAIAEGGWSNVPGDRGGETWRGIARKMWPNWTGWKIVDQWKAETDSLQAFKKALAGDATLQIHVLAFYKHNFWNTMRGDEIADQDIANDIYDDGVNTSARQGIKKAQRALSLNDTGVMDDITLSELNVMK